MARKTISRVPATPRLIRQIQPKRHHSSTTRQPPTTSADDGSSETQQHSYFSASLSSSGRTARQRFHVDEPIHGDSNRESNNKNDDVDESKTHSKSNTSIISWERYKRTPIRKKIRQFLWSLILYHSLMTIYRMDFDSGNKLPYNYGDGVQQQSYGYYDVNVKPMSESSLLFPNGKLGVSDKALAAPSEGVAKKYDFLGRLIDSSSNQNIATTVGVMTGQNGKTNDFLGYSVNSNGGSSITSSSLGLDNGHVSKNSFFDNSQLNVHMEGTFNDKLVGSRDVDPILSHGISSKNNAYTHGSSSLHSSSKLHDNIQSLRGPSNSESLLNEHIIDNTASLRSGSALTKPIGSFAEASKELQSNLNLQGNSIQSQLWEGKEGANLRTMDTGSNNKYFNPNDGYNIMSNQQSSTAAQLDCEPHGGPSQPYSDEVIYWHDSHNNIPSDASYTSPFYSKKSQEQSEESTGFWKTKYLTFEMDNSGFNNMRLGFENAMVMAHAMGRTLVLPPKRLMEHGLRDVSGRKMVSFSDFYDISAINAKQSGLNIITMTQFLQLEAMNGNLKGQYPPDNRIEWDNQILGPLWEYISNVTKDLDWHPNECVLVFPRAVSDGSDLQTVMDDIMNMKDGRPFPNPIEFQGKPTRVDAPMIERLREALGGRKNICIYDKHKHFEHDVVHFKANETDGTRLITNFNAFLSFEDWNQDLWSKRFVRDHLRYRDEIMCLSARVVSALRDHVRQQNPYNSNGDYDAIHIRRNDFQTQFPETKLSSGELLLQIQQIVKVGSTLFIATDENNRTFFRDIEAAYNVKYLGDFASEVSSINPNFFGLVEQIVASRSRFFIGTYYSSFSSFIVRLRGYYSVKQKKAGYNTGALRDTYYIPSKYKNVMRIYQAVQPPFFAREFASAWRDIDRV